MYIVDGCHGMAVISNTNTECFALQIECQKKKQVPKCTSYCCIMSIRIWSSCELFGLFVKLMFTIYTGLVSHLISPLNI